MKHARPDYAHIQDLSNKSPVDEPVFLLRAQDVCAAGVVRYWADIAEINGAKPDIIEAVRMQAEFMEIWQKEVGSKTPDLPT